MSDSVAVVGSYGQHNFTDADVDDLIRLQALCRKQKARARVAEVRKERGDSSHRLQTESAQLIALPDDDGVDYSNVAAPQRHPAHEKKIRESNSKSLSIQEMSADTKGMQAVYFRMLKSKTWW